MEGGNKEQSKGNDVPTSNEEEEILKKLEAEMAALND